MLTGSCSHAHASAGRQLLLVLDCGFGAGCGAGAAAGCGAGWAAGAGWVAAAGLEAFCCGFAAGVRLLEPDEACEPEET